MVWIRRVLWVAALIGAPLAPAFAADLAWTPCNKLEMGGPLQDLCQACLAKGMGWQFYLSRDARRTDCRHDPRPTPYRQPWMDDEERRSGERVRQERRALILEPQGPQQDTTTRALGSSGSSSGGPYRPPWAKDEQVRRDEARQQRRVVVPAPPARVQMPRNDPPPTPVLAPGASSASRPVATPAPTPSPPRESQRMTQSRSTASPVLVPGQARSSSASARKKGDESDR